MFEAGAAVAELDGLLVAEELADELLGKQDRRFYNVDTVDNGEQTYLILIRFGGVYTVMSFRFMTIPSPPVLINLIA